jgi:pantothenate kinase
MKQNVGGLVASKHRLENSLAFQKAISAALAGGVLWGTFATVSQFSLLQKLLRCTEELSGSALKTCASDVREKDNLYTISGLMLLASAILFGRMVYQDSKKAKV